MPFSVARVFLIAGMLGLVFGEAFAQSSRPVARHVEPGLEKAVRWKWTVAPSDPKDWGLALPESIQEAQLARQAAAAAAASSTNANANPAQRTLPATNSYEVKRGDALILIAKKFDLTVDQLKAFNGLTDNKIIAGEYLKIPTTAEELSTLPAAPLPVIKTPKPGKKTGANRQATPGADATAEAEAVLLQVFLDREGYSVGPILPKTGEIYWKVQQIYQSTHEDAKDADSLKKKAKASVPESFTHYTLRAEDFHFIAPPKAERADEKHPEEETPKHGKKHKAAPAVAKLKPLSYEDMVTSTMLAYRTPWQFVAERFHCDPAYLRALNPKLAALPTVGAEFRVPNVVPFEIEKAFNGPLQPQADPNNPVTATVLDLSLVEISQGGKIIAVMPMSPARPGLRGRGTWTILDAIPRPRLGTLEEPREIPKKTDAFPFYMPAVPQVTPDTTRPILSTEQYLPAGPRNPVGIIWINLTKEKDEMIPYGLHGTSIPGQMLTEDGIGGFRMTNWDILRATHLLPSGTPLEWKQTR